MEPDRVNGFHILRGEAKSDNCMHFVHEPIFWPPRDSDSGTMATASILT